MTVRVLGVDPGLTRCGVGIIDLAQGRAATLVEVGVIRTPPDLALERRLLIIGEQLDAIMNEFSPSAVALERVFAQHNLRTVMGTAQVSGVVLLAAARRGLAVGLHTPSEVKAAVTGYGSADKKQVAAMVARILRLDAPPEPADAADALALALCHAWRGIPSGIGGATSTTPAQQAWRAAERSGRKSEAAPRLDT
ncbi:crossover junction endodeoxyribonuclease RuvC [Homoserinimonas hongtaonis]|uniref:Crossover junction endodeoxyribonuclease RuvC n=1 Tax=Homoserinimonas hongtaonis TaxID=2079791 RepID=A0A2U1SYP8_9MICO|nr:crossover junction endodeoxyribonuclease RuvC [Salinibacterium hongtaonis]AWB89303.1 crossover junction endodeoxyribonuclease RuvC [Salinibacterium hongtaonis]PWB96751.1 crossover junction endodeoxyribonuclease RuvC [Salinibacterium hongtaonis]